tara:strand:- start:80 stop:292 length:213 start_codon:yes stop_codon:yes gene_type:complete
MSTPQELYDETKNRLDKNILKLKNIQIEIDEKQKEAQELTQPILEDQGALKQLEKLSDVVVLKNEIKNKS